jgi:hypothetical protein
MQAIICQTQRDFPLLYKNIEQNLILTMSSIVKNREPSNIQSKIFMMLSAFDTLSHFVSIFQFHVDNKKEKVIYLGGKSGVLYTEHCERIWRKRI